MSCCVYLLEDCNGFGYIGSTCNLKQRLKHHRNIGNRCKSKLLAKPFTHLVLEEFDNEDNMEFAEQFYIKLYKSLYGDKLLNITIPLRTDKEYYYENREKRLEDCKERYIKNRERNLNYRKNYYNENKDILLERKKNWYYENKDKIKQYYSQIIKCECGSTTTIFHKLRHLKTKKHQDFLNSQSS